MRLVNTFLLILLTTILILASCAPDAPEPEPVDVPDEPIVTDTGTETGDDSATETSTDPAGGPPGAASFTDDAAGDSEVVDEDGEGDEEAAPEGFNSDSLPDDWPEEIPTRPEFTFTVYEWDGDNLHAEAEAEFDFYRTHNYHVNFTYAGWEHDREDEWVSTGDDRLLFLKREGMVLEVNVHKLDDGVTHLILDLDKL